MANRVDDLVVGGNAKGQAVRSRDSDQGPLDAQEIAAITLALRAAREQEAIPLPEQAILWLALSTGSNASQYACLREGDLRVDKMGGQPLTWTIGVPRHKKGDVELRAQFRDRQLHAFVGSILQELIKENAASYPIDAADAAARPLFRRRKPQYQADHPLAEWRWHMTYPEITALIKRAVRRLQIVSRTDEALRVSARRFRYSMATRLIASGASQFAVADALDHTDLQNVGVYFDVHSDIVEHIDRATAIALAPRAQAFARVVMREEDAERGDHKGSRKYFGSREKDVFEPIGTCGSHRFCNVVAPLACYTCVNFQAWMDGPHEIVLETLIEAREKRAELGLEPKMVAIEDHVITEVAGLILRIEAIRAGDAAGA